MTTLSLQRDVRENSREGGVAFIAGSCFWDDFLHPSDDSVFEHDFDAMRMLMGVREDSLDDAFCELPAALILLFHHAHFHSRLDLRSDLAIHSFIMVWDPVSGIDKFTPENSWPAKERRIERTAEKKPKPTALKLIQSTYRYDRASSIESKPRAIVPPYPKYIQGEAQKQYGNMAKKLAQNRATVKQQHELWESEKQRKCEILSDTHLFCCMPLNGSRK